MKLYENIKGKSVAKKLASIVLSLVLIGSSGSMMQYSSEAAKGGNSGHEQGTSNSKVEAGSFNAEVKNGFNPAGSGSEVIGSATPTSNTKSFDRVYSLGAGEMGIVTHAHKDKGNADIHLEKVGIIVDGKEYLFDGSGIAKNGEYLYIVLYTSNSELEKLKGSSKNATLRLYTKYVENQNEKNQYTDFNGIDISKLIGDKKTEEKVPNVKPEESSLAYSSTEGTNEEKEFFFTSDIELENLNLKDTEIKLSGGEGNFTENGMKISSIESVAGKSSSYRYRVKFEFNEIPYLKDNSSNKVNNYRVTIPYSYDKKKSGIATFNFSYTLNPGSYNLKLYDENSQTKYTERFVQDRTKGSIINTEGSRSIGSVIEAKNGNIIFKGWSLFTEGDYTKSLYNGLADAGTFTYSNEIIESTKGIKNIEAYAIYQEVAPEMSITVTTQDGAYQSAEVLGTPTTGNYKILYNGEALGEYENVSSSELVAKLKDVYESKKDNEGKLENAISIVKKSSHSYLKSGPSFMDSEPKSVQININDITKKNFGEISVREINNTEGEDITSGAITKKQSEALKEANIEDVKVENTNIYSGSTSVFSKNDFSITASGDIEFKPGEKKVLLSGNSEGNITFKITISRDGYNNKTLDFKLNVKPYKYKFKKVDITATSESNDFAEKSRTEDIDLGNGSNSVESGDYKGMKFDHWNIYGNYSSAYEKLEKLNNGITNYSYKDQSINDFNGNRKFAYEIIAVAVYKQPTPSVSITVDNKNKNGEVTVTGLKEGANYKIIDNSGKSKKSTDADKSYTSVELEEAMKKNPESFKDKDIILLAPEVSLNGYRGIDDFSFLDSDKGKIILEVIEKDKDDTKDPGKGSGEDKDDTKNSNKPEDNKPNGGGSTYIENKDKDKDKDGLDKEPQTAPGKTKPISGKDRYETAVEASKKNFDKADTVVLVNGKAPVDALTSTNLAYEKKAPILLSKADSVPDVTLAEIQRLGAKNIILIGGENTLNSSVVSKLQSLGLAVDRVGGVDRYDTASKIVDRLYSGGYVSTSAMLVSGQNFIDALSIAGNAAYTRVPVLLVKKNSLTTFTEASLAKYHLNEVSIIGGSDSVGEAVRSILGKSNIKISKTIAGLDRYETSSGFAKATLASKKAYLASGVNISDALVIGPVAAKDKASILITRKSKLPKSIREVIEKGNFSDITIVGGSDSVDEDILD